MRLIDADRLLKPSFTDMFDKPVKMDMFSRYAIESQPTVKAIPLDKPICKAVYGDYVCYNRGWLMKHLPMELDILQGESIPIDWIREYTNNKTVEFGDMWVFINGMINDWEKENEKS